MRRILVYLTLVVAACAPTVVATHTLTPSPSPQTFAIPAELSFEGDPYPLRDPIVANGDETLTFRLDFNTKMDVGSVIAAVQAHMPDATAFRAFGGDDRSVVFEVPPGSTAFTIDPRGARTIASPNVGIVAGTIWNVTRPQTILSLYRPADVAAGSVQPAETYTFAFNADPGLLRVDPTRQAALVSVARPQHLSFVELSTGARTLLPEELNKIGSSGAYMHWLADGRFLTLGWSQTVISGPRGEDRRSLPTLPPGQSGWVSPNERLLALASYSADQVAIQDLETGEIRSLGTEYRRCSAYSSAGVSWSPNDTTVAIGYCGEDMRGAGRTVFADVATLRRVWSLEGWSVVAWLQDGTMLGRSWSDDSGNLSRTSDSALAVLDGHGRVVRKIDSPMPYGVSPDGRWLVDGGLDTQNPAIRLVDITTGRSYPLGITGAYPTWTADGLIAVLARA